MIIFNKYKINSIIVYYKSIEILKNMIMIATLNIFFNTLFIKNLNK